MYILAEWESGRKFLLCSIAGGWIVRGAFLGGSWSRRSRLTGPAQYPELEAISLKTAGWENLIKRRIRPYQLKQIDPEEAAMILFQIGD